MNQRDKDNTDLIKLEHVLITQLRPAFLAITFPDEYGTIQVVISCFHFDYKSIPERVASVFNLINEKIPDIINDRLILVQAYSSEEMTLVLEEVFT